MAIKRRVGKFKIENGLLDKAIDFGEPWVKILFGDLIILKAEHIDFLAPERLTYWIIEYTAICGSFRLVDPEVEVPEYFLIMRKEDHVVKAVGWQEASGEQPKNLRI